MTDILGPADAQNAVTARPADGRTFGALDSWFKDCTSDDLDDGTEINADFYNGMVAALRAIWRVNGSLAADPSIKIVPEVGSNDYGLVSAIQHLIQRGQVLFGVDTGAVNTLMVSLAPALKEYKAGLAVRVLVKLENTGPSTISINGLPSMPIIYPDGSALRAGGLAANGVVELTYTGAAFQLMGAPANVLAGARSYYVSNAGSDTNIGDAAHPFATVQKAVDTANLFNLNGYTVTINVAAGNFPPFTAGIVNGTGLIAIVGAGSATVFSSASGAATTFLGKNYSIDKVKVQSSADSASSPGSGVVCTAGGFVEVKSVEFGACYNSHISADAGGTVRLTGPFVVSGGGQAHITARGSSLVYSAAPVLPAITFANAVTFSVAFAYSMHAEINFLYASISGAGSVSGSRYLAIANGIIVTFAGETYLPGNAAGTKNTGGQYL